MNESMKIDAVFEGGGVKGIGLVGAVAETEKRNFKFENVAGTSAGAIVASLVAAGYDAKELKDVMDRLDYGSFKDKSLLDKIPIVGPMLSLGFEKGIYEGDYFEGWLKELLSAKKIQKFGDLVLKEYEHDPAYKWNLQVVAADLTNGRLLRLPRHLDKYKVDRDDFDVARAVRMSMSIPFFFEPTYLEDLQGNRCVIVDGGILSNYPIWIFDDGTEAPPWPTIGYKLVDDEEQKKSLEGRLDAPRHVAGPISMLAALFTTMMEAHDKLYIEDSNFARTIPIPTLGVETIDFDLDKNRADALYESGQKSASEFFERWKFATWVAMYRAKQAAKRSERVLK